MPSDAKKKQQQKKKEAAKARQGGKKPTGQGEAQKGEDGSAGGGSEQSPLQQNGGVNGSAALSEEGQFCSAFFVSPCVPSAFYKYNICNRGFFFGAMGGCAPKNFFFSLRGTS